MQITKALRWIIVTIAFVVSCFLLVESRRSAEFNCIIGLMMWLTYSSFLVLSTKVETKTRQVAEWFLTTLISAGMVSAFVMADGYGTEVYTGFGVVAATSYAIYIAVLFPLRPALARMKDRWLNTVEFVIGLGLLAQSAFLWLLARGQIVMDVPDEAFLGFGAFYGAGFLLLVLLYTAEKDKGGCVEGLVLFIMAGLYLFMAGLALASNIQGRVISEGCGFSQEAFAGAMVVLTLPLLAFNSVGEGILTYFKGRAIQGVDMPRLRYQLREKLLPPPPADKSTCAAPKTLPRRVKDVKDEEEALPSERIEKLTAQARRTVAEPTPAPPPVAAETDWSHATVGNLIKAARQENLAAAAEILARLRAHSNVALFRQAFSGLLTNSGLVRLFIDGRGQNPEGDLCQFLKQEAINRQLFADFFSGELETNLDHLREASQEDLLRCAIIRKPGEETIEAILAAIALIERIRAHEDTPRLYQLLVEANDGNPVRVKWLINGEVDARAMAWMLNDDAEHTLVAQLFAGTLPPEEKRGHVLDTMGTKGGMSNPKREERPSPATPTHAATQSGEQMFVALRGVDLGTVREQAEKIAEYMNSDEERTSRFEAKSVGLKNPRYSQEAITAESAHELANLDWLWADEKYIKAITACIEAGMKQLVTE